MKPFGDTCINGLEKVVVIEVTMITGPYPLG